MFPTFNLCYYIGSITILKTGQNNGLYVVVVVYVLWLLSICCGCGLYVVVVVYILWLWSICCCALLSLFIQLVLELIVMTVATDSNHDGYQQFMASALLHNVKVEVKNNCHSHVNKFIINIRAVYIVSVRAIFIASIRAMFIVSIRVL